MTSGALASFAALFHRHGASMHGYAERRLPRPLGVRLDTGVTDRPGVKL
ncbi:hypothetical protein [Nonomuraea rhodomycinica]|uniref:Uncharacterized protein n=1 Tax=Nonomuraea rhodomycinica TaxID=1712872 RepID=A0A7Y6MD31_9ACTN|nr:hypothetical protein [Nonomuraea rhodomycinica]NUW44028.1 hypothetical protein [Nonomuraea rhodomycinica]